ncbi:MAG: PQQ-binding-like beta-propeller repeat protein [Candidatus Wallbacteria bacterium]|nr:PQQ-binding-like beta-propeller repeat protein [Candidatus Wallbacteria bacterium]
MGRGIQGIDRLRLMRSAAFIFGSFSTLFGLFLIFLILPHINFYRNAWHVIGGYLVIFIIPSLLICGFYRIGRIAGGLLSLLFIYLGLAGLLALIPLNDSFSFFLVLLSCFYFPFFLSADTRAVLTQPLPLKSAEFFAFFRFSLKHLVILCLPLLPVFLFIWWFQQQFRDIESPCPIWTRVSQDQLRRLIQLSLLLPESNTHDQVGYLGSIGTEESVPVLLSCLKGHDRGIQLCTISHLRGSLTELTNHEYHRYRDWKKWWRKNRHKTRKQWMLEGFREHGFDASDPPTDLFIRQLISAKSGSTQPAFLNWNASGQLKQYPREQVLKNLDALTADQSPELRLAAAETLFYLNYPVPGNYHSAAVERLSRLAIDPNLKVASSALRKANILIEKREQLDYQEIWSYDTMEIQYLGPVLDTDSVFVQGKGWAGVFDLESKNLAWTCECQVRGYDRLSDRNRIFLFDQEHDKNLQFIRCCCLDLEARKVIWQKKITAERFHNPESALAAGRIVYPAKSKILGLDLDSGDLVWELSIPNLRHTVCTVGQVVYAAGGEAKQSLFKICPACPEGHVILEKQFPDRTIQAVFCNAEQTKLYAVCNVPNEPFKGHAFLAQVSSITLDIERELKIADIDPGYHASFTPDRDLGFLGIEAFYTCLDLKNFKIVWQECLVHDFKDSVVGKDFVITQDTVSGALLRDKTTGLIRSNLSGLRQVCLSGDRIYAIDEKLHLCQVECQ